MDVVNLPETTMTNVFIPKETTTEFVPVHSKTIKQWSIFFCMALVAAWTVISNVILVLMLLRQKWRDRGDFHIQVANLGISNIIIGFIIMPSTMTYYLNGYVWSLPQVVCQGFVTLDGTLFCVNAFTLVSINVDRLFFTRAPSNHIVSTRTWHTVLKVSLPWICAMAIVIPSTLLLHEHASFSDPSRKYECFVSFEVGMLILLKTVTFSLPALVILSIAIINVSVILCAVRENHVVNLANIMCVLDVIYLVLTTPYFAVSLIIFLKPIPTVVITVALWSSYVFSAVMPLLWLLYKDFRLGCWRTVTCQTRKQRPQSYLDNTLTLTRKR